MWLIKAETNLHVGNENNSGYGIIDKAIQRDAVTSFPCINSSSLKGAINEYCTVVADSTPEQRIRIFGADKNGKASVSQKGGVVFFDAGASGAFCGFADAAFFLAACLVGCAQTEKDEEESAAVQIEGNATVQTGKSAPTTSGSVRSYHVARVDGEPDWSAVPVLDIDNQQWLEPVDEALE